MRVTAGIWPRTLEHMMEVSELVGKTMRSVENVGNAELVFTTEEGGRYKLHHDQNCCESVSIESIVGDLSDLVGEPILKAEESASNEDPDGSKMEHEYRESFTWTFYKFATRKGYVDVRWYGESNGYYSESVSFSEC